MFGWKVQWDVCRMPCLECICWMYVYTWLVCAIFVLVISVVYVYVYTVSRRDTVC